MSLLPRADVLLSLLVESFLGLRACAVVPAMQVILLVVVVVASPVTARFAEAPLRASVVVDGGALARVLGFLVGKEGFHCCIIRYNTYMVL